MPQWSTSAMPGLGPGTSLLPQTMRGAAPCLRQGQPEHGHGDGAARHFTYTLCHRVDKVFHHLKDILSVAAAQQAESSIQHRAEVSISSPGRSKAGWQKVAMELPVVGTASSPVQIPAYFRPCHPNRHLEPLAHRQPHQWDQGTQSEHRMRYPCHGGRDDQEGRSLSPGGARAQGVQEQHA
jgi:hypothetical protein